MGIEKADGGSSMQEELNMEIPNEPQYLSVARLAAYGLAQKMDFPEEEIEDIKVCLSEACNTIIEKGKLKKKRENIDIHFKLADDKLTIRVDTPGNELDEKIWGKSHGLGQSFVETLMDDVHYIKNKNKGTTVEMVKYLTNTANEPLKYQH